MLNVRLLVALVALLVDRVFRRHHEAVLELFDEASAGSRDGELFERVRVRVGLGRMLRFVVLVGRVDSTLILPLSVFPGRLVVLLLRRRAVRCHLLPRQRLVLMWRGVVCRGVRLCGVMMCLLVLLML